MINAVDSSQARPRIVWLDYAKAIGIFFVVWGHMEGPYSPGMSEVIFRYIGAFHMPLFFMLSGIVPGCQLPEKDGIDLGAEAKKRAHRLLLPYGFWCMVYLLLNCASRFVLGRSVLSTFAEQVYGLLTGMLSPMWFLCTLFMIEMTFLLIWKHFKEKDYESSIIVWGGDTADNSRAFHRFG